MNNRTPLRGCFSSPTKLYKFMFKTEKAPGKAPEKIKNNESSKFFNSDPNKIPSPLFHNNASNSKNSSIPNNAVYPHGIRTRERNDSPTEFKTGRGNPSYQYNKHHGVPDNKSGKNTAGEELTPEIIWGSKQSNKNMIIFNGIEFEDNKLLEVTKAGDTVPKEIYFENGDTKYQGEYIKEDSKGQTKYKPNGKGIMTITNGAIVTKIMADFEDGKICNGKADITYTNDARYKSYNGEIKDGKPDGYGTYTHLNGDVHCGDFNSIDGTSHVKITYAKPNKDNYERYIGCTLNGLPNGEGELKLIDGTKFTGNFINGKLDGQGTADYSQSGNIFTGDFKNGNPTEGEYKLKQKDGSFNKYKGSVDMKCIPNGKGKYTFANGDELTGNFINGLLDGEGSAYYKNRGSTFEGTFKAGTPKLGKLSWSNGDIYTGTVDINANPHGNNGEYTFENGDKYTGNFFHGSLNGTGKRLFAKTGEVHDGTFRNGLLEGNGTCTFKNGDQYVGNFRNGNRDGEGKLTTKDKTPYYVSYDNNKETSRRKM